MRTRFKVRFDDGAVMGARKVLEECSPAGALEPNRTAKFVTAYYLDDRRKLELVDEQSGTFLIHGTRQLVTRV